MSERPYPHGLDAVWLASDRNGHLGVFITAGEGPVPRQALQCDCLPVEKIESLLCSLLPKVCAARLLGPMPQPGGAVDLAERGIFVHDWRHAQRTLQHAPEHTPQRTPPEAQQAYEPVAAPVTPIKGCELPAELASLARQLRLADVAFADQQRLEVHSA